MGPTGSSFQGYGYRTSSRFGSWTRIIVDGDMVSVTGPRVGVFVYRLWLAAQLLILALSIPAILAVVGLRDWRYLLLPPVLFVLHWFVGVVGAAGLWELANVTAIGTGQPTQTFPTGSVKRVRIGPGWARNGLWLVILPYVGTVTDS